MVNLCEISFKSANQHSLDIQNRLRIQVLLAQIKGLWLKSRWKARSRQVWRFSVSNVELKGRFLSQGLVCAKTMIMQTLKGNQMCMLFLGKLWHIKTVTFREKSRVPVTATVWLSFHRCLLSFSFSFILSLLRNLNVIRVFYIWPDFLRGAALSLLYIWKSWTLLWHKTRLTAQFLFNESAALEVLSYWLCSR